MRNWRILFALLMSMLLTRPAVGTRTQATPRRIGGRPPTMPMTRTTAARRGRRGRGRRRFRRSARRRRDVHHPAHARVDPRQRARHQRELPVHRFGGGHRAVPLRERRLRLDRALPHRRGTRRGARDPRLRAAAHPRRVRLGRRRLQRPGPRRGARGGRAGRLVLDGPTTAGIFSTEISTWDDPASQALNPDVDLPDTTLIPVHRSDGSGTTYIFTTYLSDESESWDADRLRQRGRLGRGHDRGQRQRGGGRGDPGAAGRRRLPVLRLRGGERHPGAALVNADGNVIDPTLESISAGPNEIIDTIPDDFRYDILGVGGEGFPIVGTHWVLAWECGYDDDVAAGADRLPQLGGHGR
jgi:hypothetical protein